MRSGILRTRAATLRLRPNAPWPSQLFELDAEGRRVRYVFKALRLVDGAKCATVSATKDRKP